jgi:deoxyribodipyrimidine photo-lyase
MTTTFPATRGDGLQRMSTFISAGRAGQAYARMRNVDQAAGRHPHVSTLSPYLRHRLILETEVLSALLKVESFTSAEKFVQEVAWRTYWKGWMENHPSVWYDYLERIKAFQQLSPALSRQLNLASTGQTGLACFDYWCRELIDTGYLHNHARMWFASIWIFTLRLPWPLGARLFMRYLCDADPASNTLSWRWVAGLHTKGKHYLARAENIARYTGGRFNPVGLLNENAAAILGDEESVAPQSSMPKPFPALPAYSPGSRKPKILLLHEDDLAPEVDSPLDQIEGLIYVDSEAEDPSFMTGTLAENFRKVALQDAIDRIQLRYHLHPDQILRIERAAELSREVIEQSFPGGELVTRHVPLGPSRSLLSEPISGLVHSGTQIQVLPRGWDLRSWPHTARGFFTFKAKLGDLVRDLC